LFGWDFVNTWLGAKAVVHGQPASLFDLHKYNTFLHSIFSAKVPDHNWSYPPHILLLIWPFEFLPYLASYVAWITIGLALYLWVSNEGGDRSRFWFLALSPVVMVNILTGQNGFFTGALIVAAFANWDRRPALAGVLFGLLTVKPQLIILIPLVLLLTRRWRVFGFAALAAVAMFATTSLIYGFEIWRVYLLEAVPFQQLVLTKGSGLMLGMMPTAFINARLMGAQLPLAWTLQAITSLTALAATIWTFWRPRDPLLSAAMLLTASLLFTPYAFNYDMAALIAILAKLRERPDNTRADTALILAVWLLPVVMMFGFFIKMAGSTLVLLAFGNRIFERLRKQDIAQSQNITVSAALSAI
jgi:alpha-1,2-mannosyltransferase